MQGQNYSFYNNNSMKDMNTSGQGGSNKQGKKSNYKYYKGDSNKNSQNNLEKNMNSGEHNQNYTHYRPRQRKNFQDMNSNLNPSYKKKTKKKIENINTNDFQYQQGNNTA